MTRAEDFTEINRQLSRPEYESAVELASSLGVRLDHRSVAARRALSRPRHKVGATTTRA